MRYYIVIVLLLTIAIGCTPTPEQKAQNLIKEYICNHLNNPGTYEPVEFGKLDTISIESKIQEIEEEISSNEKGDDLSNEILVRVYQDWVEELREQQLLGEDIWRIKTTHKFRLVVLEGKKLFKYSFMLNPELTEVVWHKAEYVELIIEN